MTAHWSIANPTAAVRELEQMMDRHPALTAHRTGDLLQGWYGSLDVDGVNHPIEVFYPHDFPRRAPLYFDLHHARLRYNHHGETGHQYPNGALCLYVDGTGPDSWRSTYTAADGVDRMAEFLRERHEGTMPTDYFARRAAQRWQRYGHVVVPSAQSMAMAAPGSAGRVTGRKNTERSVWIIEAHHAQTGPEGLSDDHASDWTPVPTDASFEGAWWALSDAETAALENLPDWDTLLSTTPSGLRVPETTELVLLYPRQDAVKPHPLALVHPGSSRDTPHGVGGVARVEVDDLHAAMFRRLDGAAPAPSALRSARAVMVGLGSLGSTVAEALARAGICHFDLFDPDVLEPANLSRHLGRPQDLYRPKVDVVADHLNQISPAVRVRAHHADPVFSYGFQTTEAYDALRAALRDPHAVLVTTAADPYVEAEMNQLSVQANRPAVYAAVLGNAQFARVVRVIPHETACLECISQDQTVPDPLRPVFSTGLPSSDLGTAAYLQGGVPGLAIDVAHAGLIAARLTLSSLAQRCGTTLPGWPDDWHHVLWSSQRGWVFDHPLQGTHQRHDRREDCVVCGSVGMPTDVDERVRIQLSRLLTRASGATV